MKDRFQIIALTIVITIIQLVANGQPLNNTMNLFNNADSLFQLQKNYPPVYNHLLNEFKEVKELYYSARGNTLFISFTKNNQKIFTVYSTNGVFRHSIADIGMAIPAMITEQLKTEYPGYSVYYGKEIRTNNKNTYQVVIENKNEYRLINFIDAEMEEVKRFKK
jgi:hypothetical protein